MGKILRVTIDRDRGVTLDDCAAVSRDLSTALDVEDLIDLKYSLEVSSPGLDRPLQTARDFARQAGRLVKVKLIAPAADGQMALRGDILGASPEEDTVRMEVDGKTHVVATDNIRSAKLVFELPAQPKQSFSKKGGRKKKK